ncbi:TetR/AcrR family transcriptional regulator [Amycolatopsis taiwanensis]|uniref:TetR/AcrR family transcriptional regulator n=1 Tax=Amycolatopsis taiwanensis TaxID=342230 RepID=UPI000A068EAC|nr:TetR/AcrR family transcriptional regulator [Amycolatopsis taiwanensis]
MTSAGHDQADRGLRAAGVARNRRNILAAARKHLIQAGFRKLSLDQVAKDAGVTRVTIYRQFTSKLGLLDAVAEELAQRANLVAGIQAAAAVDDPVAAFKVMVAELCRFWSTDPDLLRRLISLSAVDPEANQVINDREQWRFEQVAKFVQRLADAGRLRTTFDAQQAGVAIGAATGFPACDEMANRLRLSLDQLDRLLLALLSGVVRLD